MILLNILNVFIIGSIILFIFAYFKLENTSINLINYLHSFKIINIISTKTTDMGVILIISCLHVAVCVEFNVIGNIFNFLDFSRYSYDLKSLIKIIYLITFIYFIYSLIRIFIFSIFIIYSKEEEVQRYYFKSKLSNSKSNIYKFMETYMSYNSINNAKNIINKKHLDDVLKNQFILIESFCLDNIFNKSTPKEIINYAKTVEDLLCILNTDYIDNKSYKLSLKKRAMIEKKLNQFNLKKD